jgi:quinoprotein glucose dehydrogenase
VKRAALLGGLGVLLACGGGEPLDPGGPLAEWRDYAGDKGGLHYSPLTQITADNVADLEPAWVFHHGDISDGSDGTTRTSFNATPLVVEDGLYFCTGFNRVFALDAESGEQRWVFDPQQRLDHIEGPYPRTCRGVAYWESDDPGERGPCRERILTGTLDSQLIALDAHSGRPCADFGQAGRVALREGVGEAPPWEYYPTSPPLVLGDVVVIGALVADNLRRDAPAGVVRAFDVRSGALVWAWDPVPPGWRLPAPGQGGPRYTAGTPNVWAIPSGDPERGLVFVPMGNASPDYFSGLRQGLDHYSSSLVALDAATGAVVWSFQTVHHDVWDYDLAPQPALWDFPRDGERVPVVVQATKMGLVFVLDRRTGEPLFPVEERPVPARDVPGETVTPTQPFPTHIPPLHPQRLDPDDAWGFTRWDREACREKIAGLRSEGIFTPPSLKGSIHYPGSAGGANWGGVAIDPLAGVMYVNTMRVPSVVTLVPRAEYEKLDPGDYGYPNELYPMEGTPYGVKRGPLLSPLGAPCNPPPWGVMTAVDLVSGEILWESVLGSTRDQAPFPLWLEFGSPNLGGSLVTAGGVVFVGATTDKFLRGYDTRDGRLVWKQRLPYTASATPMTYRLRPGGRQYLVVAAGGHGWSQPGDAVMAFALPE